MEEVQLASTADLLELEIETFEIEELRYLDANVPAAVSTSSTTSSTTSSCCCV
ncbi:thiazolylpeptide-type bacteriocin [Xanthomonas albilineans]|uniref:thiazolylpeptide-type bacteriocin n=1 Tax=Xanthomonas albilineans TaxID=29447 RepID=UPI0009BC2A3E|nr:thiazolylpeptide-type bacteriocin [Xanthomonas albilineans]